MSDIILEVKELKKYFKTSSGALHAVDGVNFEIERGRTLGVVGESGCGKSTLGRTILGLTEATAGEVIFNGRDITHVKNKERKELRKKMQIIFQDPFSSLDPRMCVQDLIKEPIKSFHICKSSSEMDEKVAELMDTVGLAERLRLSYPHELDGGRRQRIGIARALAVDPEFIVCDEPVSALDVSIQAQVLNLLMDLQDSKGLTYIFVTHDLSVVKHISDDILVMYMGCMVEKCASDELFATKYHPYTKGLISAIPIPDLHIEKKRVKMEGEITSPVNPKPGCRFAPRCPYAADICRTKQPILEEITPGHFVACHCVREVNGL